MARKTKEDALETRHRILDAAVEVFFKQGVSGTTLNDIAQQAGVTRGAIYWHFTNKVELFDAMIERLVCPLLLFQDDEREALIQADPLGFIRRVLAEFLDKMVSEPGFCRVFEILWHKCEYVGDMASIRDKRLEEGNSHIDVLQYAFAQAQAQGQIGPDLTPHQATIGMVAMVDGLFFNWTKKQDLFPLQTYALPLLEVYLRGLGGKG